MKLRKILSLLLAVVMIFEVLPLASLAAELEGELSVAGISEDDELSEEEILALESEPDSEPYVLEDYSAENGIAVASEEGIMLTATSSDIVRYCVLILDTSGSMSGTPLTVQKQAAIKFCESVLEAEGTNYVAIIRLNSSATTVCSFTSNLTTLKNSINSLTASGNTNTGAALALAGNLLAAVNNDSAIKNIILCSDGLPVGGSSSTTGPYTSSDYSGYKLANYAYNTAQTLKEKYTVYTLGFFHSLSGKNLTFGEKLLSDIATDGCFHEVTSVDDLEFEFGNISGEITYTPFTASGTFYYQSVVTGQRESYSFSYTDEWFTNSPYTTYQHALTQMSIRVAMAAFAPDNDSTNGVNATNLMLQMGFSEIVSSYPEPQYDTIGYSIGSKTISSPSGEESTLLVVAVRGGGYGAEWGGNFRLLPSYTTYFTSNAPHEGFQYAANQVLAGIKEYAETHTMLSSVKIWICGFSRAAATSNLVGAELIDSVTGNSLETYVDGLTADGVYTFCFECPLNTLDSDSSNSRYSSIINIVNPADLVPKVAPSDLGYKRYGTTLYTPSNATTSNYATTYKQSMMTNYISILTAASAGTPINELISQSSNQTAVLDDIVSAISDSLKNGHSSSNWRINYLQLQDQLIAFAAEAMGGAEGDTSVGGILLALNSAFPSLIGSVVSLYFNGGTIDSVSYAHYPELCLAWLDSTVSQSYFESQSGKSTATTTTAATASSYRKIYINCPVDVEAYDDSGNLVAEIISDTVQEIDDGVGAYIDADGQKVLILPTDMEYTVNLTATDDGEVTYTATEYSISSGEVEKVVSYYEVEVAEGETLVGTVENLESVNEAEYPLTVNNAEITPSISLTASQVESYTVEVTTSDGGTVSGGGTYTVGEFAMVTATADEGYSFSGWYLDGVLVSTEAEYRFLVSASVSVAAVFKKDSTRSDILTTWLTNPANYSAISALIAKAEAMNPDDYTNFSDVTAAIEAVNWKLNALAQSIVDGYASAIESAIASLIPVESATEEVTIEEPVEEGSTETEC
ncbi:MAG: VWA domain-containing protein [Oscillospiraceae bacterium]|nr:VWA domain-containing protein [Oscillospiraceae bacterium]